MSDNEKQLRQMYYQMIDSGEYRFPEQIDVREHNRRMASAVKRQQGEFPWANALRDEIDPREEMITYLRPLAHEIASIFQSWGAELPPIFVGSINDAALNATLRSALDAGVVVLYNHGLFSFSYQAAKIIANSERLSRFSQVSRRRARRPRLISRETRRGLFRAARSIRGDEFRRPKGLIANIRRLLSYSACGTMEMRGPRTRKPNVRGRHRPVMESRQA